MNGMYVKTEAKIRKGEAGTIVLSVPQTTGFKSLTIDLPQGITSTSGSVIYVAPSTINVDIPLFVTKDAPNEFVVKFHLEESKQTKKKSIELTKEHLIKIEK